MIVRFALFALSTALLAIAASGCGMVPGGCGAIGAPALESALIQADPTTAPSAAPVGTP